jgi:hypothetical protein
MSHNLACLRCGASLSALSLPLSRRDQCPECSADLHVCKMCVYFDKSVPRQCREDGAEDVKDKDRPNFCDWFKPSDKAFDSSANAAAEEARDALAALFGDDS